MAQGAYRPALVYIDSDRYLRGAGALDPLGYRALLWPLQRAGGLATVAAVQHLLGLAMACALYAVLRRHGLWRWAAAIAVAPVLLDGYQIQAEQTIMPDVMFEALIVASLAILLCAPAPAWRPLAVAGLLLGAAVDVRQVGAVLIAPALVFVLLPAARSRTRLLRAATMSVSFALPVLIYMTVQFAMNGQFTFTQRSSYIFYGRAAAAANCAALRLPADERALCPSRQVVAALGIDGLVGDPAGPLLSYRPPPGRTIGTMADRFDRAVITQQPLAVATAIDRDAVKLFALTRDQDPGDTPITRWQFQTTYPTYPALITLRYVASIRPGGSRPAVSVPVAAILRRYQLHGGFTPGPVLALAAIAGLVGICTCGTSARRHATLGRACLLVLASAAGVVLVSDSYEFSWRYQLPGIVLLPAAGLLGIAAISARATFELALWRRLRAIPQVPRVSPAAPSERVDSVTE
jgi:Dolichyl-phosphate-mannose-protein mannosyltransferase